MDIGLHNPDYHLYIHYIISKIAHIMIWINIIPTIVLHDKYCIHRLIVQYTNKYTGIYHSILIRMINMLLIGFILLV
jgi:hypothetical protein